MLGKGLLGGAIAVVAAACLLIAAPAASAFIYWGDTQHQTIERANNDGTEIDKAFIPTGSQPFAIALDSSHVYWANKGSNSIGRANIDGSGVNNSFITGITEPDGVAVTASSIYWATVPGKIGRANINGTGKNLEFITGASEPCGVAVDSGHLYWADIVTGVPAYIGRAGLDGFNKELTYVTIPGTSFPCGVAVNSANIFWGDFGFFGNGTRIGRVTISGSGADPSFIGDASGPCGIALDGTHLYWANGVTGTIARANSDGTAVNESFISTGNEQPCGVAVDSLAPPQSLPTSVIPVPRTTIERGPGGKLGQGIARFSFRSSVTGSSFECRLDRGKRAACRSPKRYAHLGPGRHVFRVWAIDAAGRDPTPAKRSFRVPG